MKGLGFKTSSASTGTTAAQGKFSCKRGEVVTFTLKNFELGQAACGEKIFVTDLFAPVGVNAADYQWSQAAAVIQSFATGTAELDLSGAQASTNVSLTGLSFSSNATTFDSAVAALVTSQVQTELGVSAKTAQDAEGEAHKSLIEHGSLDSTFAGFLDALIAASSDNTYKFVVKASLASGTKEPNGTDFCDSTVEALMKVTKNEVVDPSDSSKKKVIYTLTPDKAISYTNANHVSGPVTCKLDNAIPNTEDNTCDNIRTEMLPKAKLLTGLKFDVAASANVDDYLTTGLDVASYTVVSMAATPETDGVKISGTFYNELKVLSNTSDAPFKAGDKASCLYNIVDEK